MMTRSLHLWRKQEKLTQVEAAMLLGISQPYFSLLEKGVRPLTKRLRYLMKATAPGRALPSSKENRFRAELSALGYPGFAHIAPARNKRSADALLMSVLNEYDADPRVADALPWLVHRFAAEMNFPSMVHQAKLRNLQNRLGFVLQVSGADSPELNEAIRELERARLLEELLGPLGMVRSGAAGSIAVAAAQGSARRPSRQT